MYYTIKELNKLNPTAAKKIAKEQGTKRQWHPPYNELTHPNCSIPGCDNPKIVMDWHWTSGEPVYRPVCNKHHLNKIAEINGFDTHTEFLNTKHPYRQFRKDYCENIDQRLGYECTSTIVWDGQLDVDHIDEDPTNNEPGNLQTLCKCCHAYKSNIFVKENGRTPGRKALGVTY